MHDLINMSTKRHPSWETSANVSWRRRVTHCKKPATRGPKPARGRFRRGFSGKNWYAWAMVAPIVAVLAVLVIYPLARGLHLSLTDANEANIGRDIGVNHIPSTYTFVGLKNYIDVLSGNDGTFYGRLVWTLEWTAVGVFFHYTIGLGLAVLLNRPMRFRLGYRMMLILPWAVPAFVSAFAWRLILNGDAGPLDAVLVKLGLPSLDWLGQPFTAKVSVIAVNVWLGRRAPSAGLRHQPGARAGAGGRLGRARRHARARLPAGTLLRRLPARRPRLSAAGAPLRSAGRTCLFQQSLGTRRPARPAGSAPRCARTLDR
jgi:hypothetical protein